MTRGEREALKVVVSELINALRHLLSIATKLRHSGDHLRDESEQMEAAIERAARAMKRLQLKRRSEVAWRELRRRSPRQLRRR